MNKPKGGMNPNTKAAGSHKVAVVLHELVERMRRVVQYDRDRSPPRLSKAHNLKTRPCPLTHSFSLLRRAGLASASHGSRAHTGTPRARRGGSSERRTTFVSNGAVDGCEAEMVIDMRSLMRDAFSCEVDGLEREAIGAGSDQLAQPIQQHPGTRRYSKVLDGTRWYSTVLGTRRYLMVPRSAASSIAAAGRR